MSKFFNALAVAVLGIALLMGAASAATTTSVGGDVIQSTTINVLVTSNDFGDFVIGDNTLPVTDLLHVATNSGIKLQAAETGATTNDGKMATASEAKTLGTQLKVGIDSFTAATVSGTAATVSDTITAGTDADSDGTFVQKVLITDSIADDYTITLTFTSIAA